MRARLKIPIKGLVVDAIYDVSQVVSGEFHNGNTVTAVHLKKYTDSERKKFRTIVVPWSYVELIPEEVK